MLKQTIFFLRSRRGFDEGVGHQAPESSAATLFRNQHAVQSERSQAGNPGKMPVGPVADQPFLIEVVRGGDQSRLETILLQFCREVLAKLHQKPVRLNISGGPFDRSPFAPPVAEDRFPIERDEIDDDGASICSQISGQEMSLADPVLQFRA